MPIDTVVLSDNMASHVSSNLMTEETLRQRAPHHISSLRETDDHVNTNCAPMDNLMISGTSSNNGTKTPLTLSIEDMHRIDMPSIPQNDSNNALQNDKKNSNLLLMHHHHNSQISYSSTAPEADMSSHLGASGPASSSLSQTQSSSISNHEDSSSVLTSVDPTIKSDDKNAACMNHFAPHGQLSSSLDTGASILPSTSTNAVMTNASGGQPPSHPPLHPFHQLTSTSALHNATAGGMLTQSHAPSMSASSAATAEGRVNPGNVSEFELARRLGVRFDSSNAAWVARWVDSQNDRKKSRWFSIAKYGNAAARRLAIQACLHNMKPSDFLNLRDLQEVLKTFNTSPPVGAQPGFPGMMRNSGLMDVHAMQAMGLFGAGPGSKLAQYGHPHLLHHAHQQQSVAAAVAAHPFGIPGFTNTAMAGYMAAAAAAAAMPPGMSTHPAAAAAALAGVFCPQLTAQQQQFQNFAAALQHQHQLHQQTSNQVHPNVVPSNENHVMVNNSNELSANDNISMAGLQTKQKKEHTLENPRADPSMSFATPEAVWGSNTSNNASIVDQQCKFGVYEESAPNASSVQSSSPCLKSDLNANTKRDMSNLPNDNQHGDNSHNHQLNAPEVSPMLQSRIGEQQFLPPMQSNNGRATSGLQDNTSPSRFVLSDNSLSGNEDENSSPSSSLSSDIENRSDASLTSDDDGTQSKNEDGYSSHKRKKRRVSEECNNTTETLSRTTEHETAAQVHNGETSADQQAVGTMTPHGMSPFGFFNPAGVAGGIQNAAAMAAAAAAANHLQSSYYSFYSPTAFHQQQNGNNSNMISQTHPVSPQNHHAQSWMMPQQHGAPGGDSGLQHASLPFLSPQFNLPMLHPHLQSSHHAVAAAVASGGFFPQTHHPAFDLVNVHNENYNQFLKGIGGTGAGGPSGSAAASSGML